MYIWKLCIIIKFFGEWFVNKNVLFSIIFKYFQPSLTEDSELRVEPAVWWVKSGRSDGRQRGVAFGPNIASCSSNCNTNISSSLCKNLKLFILLIKIKKNSNR